jgi:hypothetical protein
VIAGWHALRYSEGHDTLAGSPRPSEYLRACHPFRLFVPDHYIFSERPKEPSQTKEFPQRIQKRMAAFAFRCGLHFFFQGANGPIEEAVLQ